MTTPAAQALRRAALLAAALVTALALLTACTTQRAAETDPTLEALKADAMGRWAPEGFGSTVVTSGHTRTHRGITTTEPGLASWTRVYTSGPQADLPDVVIRQLTAAAEEAGWQIDYTGPADLAAHKTINGEPAVLYGSINKPATNTLAPSETYQLHISLQS